MKRRDFLSLCGLAAGSCLVPDAIARVIRDTCVLAREPYLILPRNPKDTLYAYSGDGKTDFMLHIGDPTIQEPAPTWREYFEEYEFIDIKDKDAVRDWWMMHVGDPDEHRSAGALGVDPADAGPAGRDEQERASQHPITIEADAEIDGAAYEQWEHRSAGALGVDPANAGPERARRAGASESMHPFGIDPNAEIDGVALERWENMQEIYDGPSARAFHLLRDLPLDDGRKLKNGNPLGELEFIEGDRPGSNLTYVEAPDLATLACLQNRLNELGQNYAIEIREW